MKKNSKEPSEAPGRRVKRLRQAANLSQAELAEQAGVPIGTLRNWEQGRRVPLLDNAAQIAKALGVGLDYLTEGTNATKKPRGRGKGT